MLKRLVPFICVFAVAASAFAANLGKYNNWPKTPQGYFMTRAERADWAKLQSESDAEQFVRKFVASRGPSFEADVAAAAKAADDHLSVGGDLGSRTMRGKIVVLLGPPTSFTIVQKQVKTNTSSGNAAIDRKSTRLNSSHRT